MKSNGLKCQKPGCGADLVGRQEKYCSRACQASAAGATHWEVKLEPCGTLAAWRRHMRRKEPVDRACKDAINSYHNDYRRRRRSA